MTSRRSRKSAGGPPDQCSPPEMIGVLLERLANCELDEFKKSILCAELNDLLWFFEKHPKSVDMFRTDLIEWRTFLKQSKTYMDDMFDKKMDRTKRIVDHVSGKTKVVKSNAKKPLQPSYYQILYRPGMRSVRQYPIDVEHYGEHNANIDQLHRQTAALREEIIYAPHEKLSRADKKVFLDILMSIVEICAYDVLYAVGFIEELRILINSIVEGDEYRKKTNIVSYMSSLTSKLKEKAKCQWMEGNCIKKKMWDDIASIEKKLELSNRPKFDLELLSRSRFLKMEKLDEMASKNVTLPGVSARKSEPLSEEKSQSPPDWQSTSESKVHEISSVSLSSGDFIQPIGTRDCQNAGYRLDFTKGTHIQEVRSDDNLACGSSTNIVCASKIQVKQEQKKEPLEEPSVSPVKEWADNIIKKYGPPCECSDDTDEEDVCAKKDVRYIFDAEEEETLFKFRKPPRKNYGLLKHVTIPPPPKDTDKDTPLAEVLRVELEDDQDEPKGDLPEPRLSDINPFLGRTRLLK